VGTSSVLQPSQARTGSQKSGSRHVSFIGIDILNKSSSLPKFGSPKN